MKKSLKTFIPTIRLTISAATGFGLGRGLVALHDYYLEFPQVNKFKKVTIKDFYETKYGKNSQKKIFLPTPEHINGVWKPEELSRWQQRAAYTWLFKHKRKSNFWTTLLKGFDDKLKGARNKAEAKQKSESITQEDLISIVTTCENIKELEIKKIDDEDGLDMRRSYMKDSWVACSYPGTIISLDKDWPLYD